jgi:hypothetical protein
MNRARNHIIKETYTLVTFSQLPILQYIYSTYIILVFFKKILLILAIVLSVPIMKYDD